MLVGSTGVVVFIMWLLFMLWILSLDSSGNFLVEIEFESQLMVWKPFVACLMGLTFFA
jgi:hypothetical protein